MPRMRGLAPKRFRSQIRAVGFDQHAMQGNQTDDIPNSLAVFEGDNAGEPDAYSGEMG